MDIQKFDKEWKTLKDWVRNHQVFLITTHLNPDGDAIGAVLGLYWFLKEQGKEVILVSPTEFPDFLKWMPGSEFIIDYKKSPAEVARTIKNAEVIFQLDYNEIKRSGDFKDLLLNSQAKKALIDHHPNPQPIGEVLVSDTTVSSTSEIILELILQLGGPSCLTKPMAECVFTGIMTDTGNFCHNSSTPRTFELVALLLQCGIDKDEIFRLVYNNFSVNRMKMMGYCLYEKMQVFPEYKTAIISLNQEEQKRFKFEFGDSEGFVNLPLSIKDVIFSVLFVEREDKIKVSLRSRGKFAVNQLSQQYFSGGGHINAAGGESLLSLEETVQKFIDLLPAYKEDLNN